MALSNKYKRLSLITILTFILLMQASFASARMSQQQMEDTDAQIAKQLHYYSFDSDLIVVFYDEHDSLMNDTALSLVNSIGLMTPNIVGVPVNSLVDIETVLEYTPYMVAIYVFQSDTEGLFIHERIGDSNIKQFGWRVFAETLNSAGQTKHILAMGNTMQLHKYLDIQLQSNVYASQDEQVDAQHMFIYALWTLADILEAETGKRALLGEDIRMASLKYFADNFNQLAS